MPFSGTEGNVRENIKIKGVRKMKISQLLWVEGLSISEK
jgi:hypothetical protein